MNNFTETFFAWADSNQITRQEIAEATGNSVKTISTWRSIGIPKGKQLGCQSLIDRANTRKIEDIRGQMILRPTHEQFTRWNKAALAEGQTIEDWAFAGLERIATEHFKDAPRPAAEATSNHNDSANTTHTRAG